MDAIALLKKDHLRVESLFASFQKKPIISSASASRASMSARGNRVRDMDQSESRRTR